MLTSPGIFNSTSSSSEINFLSEHVKNIRGIIGVFKNIEIARLNFRLKGDYARILFVDLIISRAHEIEQDDGLTSCQIQFPLRSLDLGSQGSEFFEGNGSHFPLYIGLFLHGVSSLVVHYMFKLNRSKVDQKIRSSVLHSFPKSAGLKINNPNMAVRVESRMR